MLVVGIISGRSSVWMTMIGALAGLDRADAVFQADRPRAAARRHVEAVLGDEIGAVAMRVARRQDGEVRLAPEVEIIRPVGGVGAERDIGAAPPEFGVPAVDAAAMAPHHRGGRRPGDAGARAREARRIRRRSGGWRGRR